jgi:hypothetical protein
MINRPLIINKLLFTIQCMIENALLHSILDINFEQIKWPWLIPQDDNQFDLLHELLKIRKWGNLQKRQSE